MHANAVRALGFRSTKGQYIPRLSTVNHVNCVKHTAVAGRDVGRSCRRSCSDARLPGVRRPAGGHRMPRGKAGDAGAP